MSSYSICLRLQLLADFVGKRLAPPSKGYDQQWEFPFCDGYYPTLKTMKFKTSWDWLMPVIAKISEYRLAYPEQCDKVCNQKVVIWIDRLYPLVVEFIKWYNENKKV